MPELPEVEVLVRHLRPLLRDKKIRAVNVHRAKVIRPDTPTRLRRILTGATFRDVSRRGKYLLFQLQNGRGKPPIQLVGHLGMTGRMFLTRKNEPLPKHAAVVLDLGREHFIYEDPRYFGRFSLNSDILPRLGPEPLSRNFTPTIFAAALAGRKRAIKVRLLDQDLVAGIGNIYASEALYRARINPRRAAGQLKPPQIRALWRAIRAVLNEAIRFGSTVPLHYGAGAQRGDRLFYYGLRTETPAYYSERLRVYDRAGQPCGRCQTPIKRLVQAGRSTFYCPQCQR